MACLMSSGISCTSGYRSSLLNHGSGWLVGTTAGRYFAMKLAFYKGTNLQIRRLVAITLPRRPEGDCGLKPVGSRLATQQRGAPPQECGVTLDWAGRISFV